MVSDVGRHLHKGYLIDMSFKLVIHGRNASLSICCVRVVVDIFIVWFQFQLLHIKVFRSDYGFAMFRLWLHLSVLFCQDWLGIFWLEMVVIAYYCLLYIVSSHFVNLLPCWWVDSSVIPQQMGSNFCARLCVCPGLDSQDSTCVFSFASHLGSATRLLSCCVC